MMFKRILSLVFVLMIVVSMFAGCGSKDKSEEGPAQANSQAAPMQDDSQAAKSSLMLNEDVGNARAGNADAKTKTTIKESDNGAKQESKAAGALTDSGTANQTLSNAIINQRKIIRNADISIEVDDFDDAYGRIKTLIAAFGFVQESSIKKDKVYVDSKEKLITKGKIIIRVDKDRFDSVLGDLKGLGTLLFENIKSDDVTDKFFDTESRLRLLKYEESRLLEYLKKITDPDTIFKTESRLTEIRHEIESLTGTLKKWTDLVELSTITIDMTEKIPGQISPKENSYWGKLADKFSGSFKGVISFISEILIVLAALLPVLVFLGFIAAVLVIINKKVLKNKYGLRIGKNRGNDSNKDSKKDNDVDS